MAIYASFEENLFFVPCNLWIDDWVIAIVRLSLVLFIVTNLGHQQMYDFERFYGTKVGFY